MKEARRKLHFVLFYYEMSRKGNSVETESRLVVAWGWRREQGLIAHRHEGSFGGAGNV